MANTDLLVTAPPHIRTTEEISTGMRDVLIALVPVTAVAIGFFRLYAIVNILACVLTAVVCELLMRKIMGREPTIKDCSAIVTGLLLALVLPPTVPFWYAMIGTVIAVVLVKELMGGLGVNVFNPALFGFVSLAVLSQIWQPVSLNLGSIHGVTSATPLTWVKAGPLAGPAPGYWDLFFGHAGGAMVEVSVLAILVGAAYLLYKGHITWHIPVSILVTVAVLSAIVGVNPLYMLLAGGLMLGAFFMATDWATSPSNRVAQIVYGVIIGVIVVLIRVFGAPTGAVAYAILIGNAITPLLNRMFVRKRFGQVAQAE